MSRSDLMIENFEITKSSQGTEYVSWDEIEKVMGPELFDEFSLWMNGQTSFIEGAYAGDVERFLLRLPNID